jgi:hypothetical protein
MKGRSALAICAFGLCFAGQAEARERAKAVRGHNPALTGIGRMSADHPQPLSGAGPRVRFSAESIIREDGTPGDRRSVVGTLPLLGDVAAEVGLFSVRGASPKEREYKRADPMSDIQPRRSRVAAVGLRMSF